MSRTPFTRFFQGDFLARMQAAGLEGDEIGVYTIAWALMAERRGPIDDDMAWLGRRSGVSTRRANQIRAKLLDCGLWLTRDGQIGDPVVLGEISHQNRRSAINQSNALARWERVGQPELDFEREPEKTRSRRKKAQKTAIPDDANASGTAAPDPEMQTGGKSGPKARENGAKTKLKDAIIPEETAEIRQSPPDFRIEDSRAPATPEPELEYQPTESESCPPREEALFAEVCAAAGFHPRKPEHEEAARQLFDQWRHDHIGADTILTTVRALMALSGDDPTSSLNRFDRHVRHAHARGAAKPRGIAPPAPERAPEPEEPDPRFREIRQRLRHDCGARTYDGWLRPIRFVADGQTLRAELPSHFMRDWVHTHFGERLALDGVRHGFIRVEVCAALSPQHSKPA